MFGFGKKKAKDEAGEPSPQSGETRAAAQGDSVDPAVLADLDAKRAAVAGDMNRETDLAFWKAALALPSWHFVTTNPEQAIETGNMPSILRVRDGQGRGMTLVFSSGDRASKGYRTIQERANQPSAAHATLEMPPVHALVRACGIARQTGEPLIMMDEAVDDLTGYGTHAVDLLGYWDYFFGPLPASAIPFAGEVANERGDANMLRSVFRAAIAHGTLKIPLKDDAAQLLRNEEGLFGFAFTGENEARNHTQQNGGDGLMDATFAQLLELDRTVRNADSEGVFKGFVLDGVVFMHDQIAEQALAFPDGPSSAMSSDA